MSKRTSRGLRRNHTIVDISKDMVERYKLAVEFRDDDLRRYKADGRKAHLIGALLQARDAEVLAFNIYGESKEVSREMGVREDIQDMLMKLLK